MIEPYRDINQPGRMDLDGIEWWACDPYPTWYRWDNGELVQRRFGNQAGWMPDDPQMAVRKAERLEQQANRLMEQVTELREQAQRCRVMNTRMSIPGCARP